MPNQRRIGVVSSSVHPHQQSGGRSVVYLEPSAHPHSHPILTT